MTTDRSVLETGIQSCSDILDFAEKLNILLYHSFIVALQQSCSLINDAET
jgi:hypothetical protein